MTDPLLLSTRVFGYVSAAGLLALVVGLYLPPTIVGTIRRKRNLINIAFSNLFLGWTGIAWAAMLVESIKNDGDP